MVKIKKNEGHVFGKGILRETPGVKKNARETIVRKKGD